MPIFAIISAIGFLFFVALLNTFVMSCLWTWFLTPIFIIAAPSFALLYGFMLTVSYLIPTHKKDINSENIPDVIATSITKALVFLAFGYIIHLFV